MRILERQLRLRLLRRKSNAVDRSIRLPQIPNNLLHRRLAAIIVLLADQQNRPAIADGSFFSRSRANAIPSKIAAPLSP